MAKGVARVGVAYSGGRDSTALLHATLRAAAPLGVEVVALHVHHGLSAHADAWLRHCREVCTRWARRGRPLRLLCSRMDERPARGESVEAWARAARYTALDAMAHGEGIGLVLLAHHRRDQAETVVLQALRGGGVSGLAGMPASLERGSITWARPWLGRPRQAIDDYVRRHRLKHIEDESNGEPRFARNRLRLTVWPRLIAAFPDAEASLATAAAWAQEASSALDELAAIDLETVACDGELLVDAWARLSAARRSNALRAWLRRHASGNTAATWTTRLSRELVACPQGRWLLAGGELRSYRGRLTWFAGASAASAGVAGERGLQVTGAGRYPLPGWRGTLEATSADQGGAPLNLLRDLTLLPRHGAEQFQAGADRPPRSLKKQFQAAGIASWLRGGPLLYNAHRLVFVPGLGIDARSRAAAGSPQLRLAWIADAALDRG